MNILVKLVHVLLFQEIKSPLLEKKKKKEVPGRNKRLGVIDLYGSEGSGAH